MKPQRTLEERARFAREAYWSSIDQLDRATAEPSPESLNAWIVVVGAVDGTR